MEAVQIPTIASALGTDSTVTCSSPGCSNPPAERKGTRGKKPTKCTEHQAKASTSRASVGVGSAKIASDAAAVLSNGNTVIAGALHLAGYEATAKALEDCEEEFKRNVELAFASNPALAKKIMKVFEKTGGFTLLAAYGMLAYRIAPIALLEHKMKSVADGDDA